MRKKIAAGNWKMNTTLAEGMELASEVVNMAKDEVSSDVTIILSVPFTHLTSVKKIVGSESNILVAAQNCNENESGAYTGEISVSMLKSIDTDAVVLGHSERREYYSESYDELATKTKAVLAGGLTPIFCCGEKLETREANEHFNLVKEQIESSLFDLSADDFSKIVIAYEPVWAIGTGVTASSDQAQEMHAFIRKTISEKYGEAVASQTAILYGGSVKPANASELFGCEDVDGGLVGGASLDSRGFVDIAKSF